MCWKAGTNQRRDDRLLLVWWPCNSVGDKGGEKPFNGVSYVLTTVVTHKFSHHGLRVEMRILLWSEDFIIHESWYKTINYFRGKSINLFTNCIYIFVENFQLVRAGCIYGSQCLWITRGCNRRSGETGGKHLIKRSILSPRQ